jgi:hypothetical protein
MATSVQKAVYESNLTVVETLTKTSLLSDKTVTHDALNTTKLMRATDTIDAEFVHSSRVAMTAGAATIDLTALTDVEGATIVTATKRLRAIKIKPVSTNANAVTIEVGASNGYVGFGADFSIALLANSEVMIYTANDAGAISATNKTLDITGTATQAIDIICVFG